LPGTPLGCLDIGDYQRFNLEDSSGEAADPHRPSTG
jgi:hypothetical protein